MIEKIKPGSISLEFLFSLSLLLAIFLIFGGLSWGQGKIVTKDQIPYQISPRLKVFLQILAIDNRATFWVNGEEVCTEIGRGRLKLPPIRINHHLRPGDNKLKVALWNGSASSGRNPWIISYQIVVGSDVILRFTQESGGQNECKNCIAFEREHTLVVKEEQ